MQTKAKNAKTGFFAIAALSAVLAFFAAAPATIQAKTDPEIFISWRAESYAPPAYTGKILPTAGSPVVVSFEVIDGGKPADLSNQTIYWYLNDNLIENRDGVQSVTFRASPSAPSLMNLRIELPAYPGGLLLKSVDIPVVRPEAVIDAPYPGGQFSGTRLRAIALPYFFSAKKAGDLNFSWNVNGEAAEGAENPDEFIVNLNPEAPLGSTVNVNLTVRNPGFGEEVASASARLTRKQ